MGVPTSTANASAPPSAGAEAAQPSPRKDEPLRDDGLWIYGGVTVHAMAKRARRRLAIRLDAIYRRHPPVANFEREPVPDAT